MSVLRVNTQNVSQLGYRYIGYFERKKPDSRALAKVMNLKESVNLNKTFENKFYQFFKLIWLSYHQMMFVQMRHDVMLAYMYLVHSTVVHLSCSSAVRYINMYITKRMNALRVLNLNIYIYT